ncbi:molybdopterin-guanine dinucleotide biosynthesis protein B [Thiohalocapsa sp.]|uniref:molybdopterin-guanine dinucleotide biosynthesis protein B n=1 Tax=Thiohalocapsa sp. TaxID=2497641 RepID=UPI00345B524D
MSRRFVPLVGFVAPSGTGKTTLLRKLVPLLRERGLRVGYIKHSHHSLSLDHPGKDSHDLAEAGAEQVVLAAADGWGLMDYAPRRGEDGRTPLAELAARFDAERLDLVLVEGFRQERHPKIEVHRVATGKAPLYPNDPDIIAVATDSQLPADAAPVRLPIADTEAIADFIQAQLADGRFSGEDPRDELLRRCRETRHAATGPRAGWLSIRIGERCWMARIALAGDDPDVDAVGVHLVAAADDEAPADAPADVPDIASIEATIHRRIYSTQPLARAIIGARMPYTAAAGFQGRSFQPLDADGVALLGDVPALSLDPAKLAQEGPAAIAERLVDAPVCILAGQGAYAWGEDLTQALERAALLERSAQIYVLGRQSSA